MSLIKVDDISFKYNKYILKDISFDLEKACFVSLLGINGAGKSTLLKQLVRLLKPEKGAIYISGNDIRHMSFNNMAKQVAYVSQYNTAIKNTVYDTILIGRLPHINNNAGKKDFEKVEEIIDKLGLSDYAMRDTSTLSGGEFQKVVLARALAQEPKVLLLDEPTSSLDIRNQVAVMTALIAHPLEKGNLKITDVDKYSVEMQNPDITKLAGAGDVPEANYKMIAALAVKKGELEKAQLASFATTYGTFGFAPTQGHIPSGAPFLGYAIEKLKAKDYNRVMIVGKGSLFLGRMTNLFDGVSCMIEANKGIEKEAGRVDEQQIKKMIAEAMRKLAENFGQ